MSPRISQLTTEAPNSTSDMVLNVGSTTRRANVGQIVGGIFTSQGQLAYAASSRDSTFLNPPSSGAVLTYSSGTSAPTWSIPTSGSLFTVSSAGLPAWRAAPTSGAVLVYSTASTRPDWLIPTSGGLFTVSSAGLPAWLAAPSSGAVLTYSSASSRPDWAVPTSGAVFVASSLGVPVWRAIGTSGQVLESTGGTPTWTNAAGGTTNAWALERNTTQAMTSGIFNTINWLVENLDTDAVHSTAANSSLVTVPTSGVYVITAGCQFGSTANANIALFEGTTRVAQAGSDTPGGGVTLCIGTVRYFASSGAALTVQVFSVNANSVAPVGHEVFFSGHRLS